MRPVSSRSSRAAAAAKSSPASASPFGMSQRGERVAWPSRTRFRSVTTTPQLVRRAVTAGRRRPRCRRRSRAAGPCPQSRRRRSRPSAQPAPAQQAFAFASLRVASRLVPVITPSCQAIAGEPNMDFDMRCYRPPIMGRRGAVAANHPQAAQAGLLALRAGGNAVDAAVATAAALAVVEPMMSGLGGDGFYHVYDHTSRRAIVFNGTGPAPAAATPERYRGGIPRTGPLSVSVPGMLAGLGLMHERFGRLPWRDLFAEAIRYARDGFAATPHYRHFAAENLTVLRPDPRSAAVFLAGGEAPSLAAPIVQPDLARTLAEIASEGARCFYQGALAHRLAAGLEAAGALV